MSVSITPNRSATWSARQFLPWAGMGLCLVLLTAHIAYDLLGPTDFMQPQAPQSAPGRGGCGNETDGPGHSVDHLAVGVEVPGGQDRD